MTSLRGRIAKQKQRDSSEQKQDRSVGELQQELGLLPHTDAQPAEDQHNPNIMAHLFPLRLIRCVDHADAHQ